MISAFENHQIPFFEKKNQNQIAVDPNYFKNHKEPVIYRNEPIKNHQFNGQLFDFFNFLRIVIMYQN